MRRAVHALPIVVLITAAGARAQAPAGAAEPPPSSPATAAVPAHAAESGTSGSLPHESPWRAALTFGAWLTGATGSTGVRRFDVDVEASILDVIEASDTIFAISGRVEVGYGRFAGYIDAFGADLGFDDQSSPNGFGNADVSAREQIVDFGLMYRLADWVPSGAATASSRTVSIELYGGARYSDIEITVDPARLSADISRREDWIDPVIGARLTLPFTERWSFSVNGDIGGFGVGSEFTWSATGVFGYDFDIAGLSTTVLLGYRAIGWDYSEGTGRDRFEWDIIQHGVIVGLSLRF